ncbi:MAG: adenylate/guanylate cyclase domain-containing protein [Bacteroidales bacterium]|nr:adenylate/guanylate cyclase domain-containing protein [Bacteroidales bacterium]
MVRNKAVILLFLLVLLFLNSRADSLSLYEVGTPFIRNYPPREYKGFSQNWSIVQDVRGVMYFANGDGVLEYDGVEWRMIRIADNYMVTALAIDSGNVIYVGSINEFGFLAPDIKGIMRYNSLSQDLSPEEQNFGFINKFVVSNKNEIFFSSSEGIFKILFDSDNKVSVDKLDNVDGLFNVDNKLYCYNFDTGLNLYYNDSIIQLNGGDFFKEKYVNALIENDENNLLVLTQSDGMFLINKTEADNYYKNLTITPLKTQIDNFLIRNRINYACRLSNGNIAFATNSSGTVLINKSGHIVQILNKNTGLYNDTHYFIFQDTEGAVWIALDNGISKAEINTPLTYWNDANNLKGSVLSIERFNNTLYVATWQGVFYLDIEAYNKSVLEDVQISPIFFKPVEGINATAWTFLKVEEQDAPGVLLIGTSEGLYGFSNNELKKILPHNVNKLYRLHTPNNIIIAGLEEGAIAIKIEIVNNTISFKILNKIPRLKERIISVGQTKGGEIWLGSQYKGVFLLKENDMVNDTLPFNYWPENFFKYNGSSLSGSVYIDHFHNHLLFACESGIYIFTDDSQHFMPFSSVVNQTLNGSAVVTVFRENYNGNLLLQYTLIHKGEKIIAEINFKNNRLNIISHPFKPIPQSEIWAFMPEKNGIIWLGSDEGLYRLDNKISYIYNREFQTLIRNVYLGSDSLFFGGNRCNINATFYSCTSDNLIENESISNEIEFSHNSVIFEFASLFFYDEKQNKYQYQLHGFDKKPSEWTVSTQKEYTNLPPGKYSFEVKSKNIFDQESSSAIFEFEVLAPLYRTNLAYILYVILLGCAVYLLVKYSNKRLIHAKIKLENQVSERTSEIINQKRELEKEKEKSDRLLLNIFPYKIVEELKENGFAKAKHYSKVSVMFADFSGFTMIAEKLDPEELIKELNNCFTYFDEACVRNNLEKIKTVGDAYMCAGGVPIKNDTNPIDITLAALEILRFVKELENEETKNDLLKWKIRIGIHTGEVISGVVGKKKFAYDIWGDTVNTASRLETAGEKNKINISGVTYNYIKDYFVCTYRGKIPAKHKGEIDMYFVERLKPEYSNDDSGFVPNLLFKEKYNNLLAI